jgi:hypothetical protein
MRKLFIISAFLLSCSISIFSSQVFAVTNKDDADVENIKAPPRDVKDILLVLNQARGDRTLIEKATKVLALPIPNSTDPEVLNNYYYRRAGAEETLENSKGALENIRKAAIDYPSPNLELRIDENFQYMDHLSSLGYIVEAKKIAEELKPATTGGWTITMDRKITQFCLLLGDFDWIPAIVKDPKTPINAIPTKSRIEAKN